MLIDFDYTNLLARMVGEPNGLTDSEIQQHSPQALASLRAFQQTCKAGGQGFPSLPSQSETVHQVLKCARELHGSYDTVCLAGIGGSALGVWALDCAIRGPHPVQKAFSPQRPRLVVLDNVDPALVRAALDSMQARRTLLVVTAKSGSTAETVAAFLIARDWLLRKLGRRAQARILVVTSKGRGDLAALADREGYRTFTIPDNVGGRFSVLSAVGLLPAALIGLNIRKLLQGAAAMTQDCWQPDLDKNLALRAALLHYLIWTLKKKPIQVAFSYSNRLWGTAFWFRQLWAESLGKARNRKGELVHLGQTPVAALGATDQHSQVQLYIEGPNDKVFTFWAVREHPNPGRIPRARLDLEAFDYLAGKSLAELIEAERRSTEAALVEAQHPNCTFTLDRVDEEHLGAFLQLLEFQTAFMGELLDINAFDQEGVELGKKFTYGLMGRPGYEPYRARFQHYEIRHAGQL
jgi:glucose-6-phosphate isomerase